MTQEDDGAKSGLTPSEIDHTHLPEQRMYKVALADASHFAQGSDDVQTYPLFITNDFKLIYFEMEPGARIDWHTHTPSFDEVCMSLAGSATYTLEREDGSHQVLELEPREFVYLPGGARHKIEAADDTRHEGLVAMPPDPVARLEMVEGESPYRIDDWPVALWIDRMRDEVVKKDDAAVSEQ